MMEEYNILRVLFSINFPAFFWFTKKMIASFELLPVIFNWMMRFEQVMGWNFYFYILFKRKNTTCQQY